MRTLKATYRAVALVFSLRIVVLVLGLSLSLNRARCGGAGDALVRSRVRAARRGDVFHATTPVRIAQAQVHRAQISE